MKYRSGLPVTSDFTPSYDGDWCEQCIGARDGKEHHEHSSCNGNYFGEDCGCPCAGKLTKDERYALRKLLAGVK